MSERQSQDTYQVYCSGYLGEDRLRVLTMLYQPLCKGEALALYLSLYYEVEKGRHLNAPATHYRLMNLTQLNITALNDALLSLEGLGLLRTYEKQAGGKQADYLYEIMMPLDAQHFFDNVLLNTLLARMLGEVDYERTRYYFSLPKIDEKQYQSVTHRFDEVYHVNISEQDMLQTHQQFEKNTQKEPQVAYDMEMFYRGLQDYQIPRSAITPKIEQAIAQYGMIYHIAPSIMRELVYDVYDQQKITLEDLAERCLRYYEFESQRTPSIKSPIVTSIKQSARNTRENKIRQLSSLSPYEYLSALQGGSEPTARDLRLIDHLMTRQQLPPGVVNVLLEIVLKLNQGQLPRNHLEYLAGLFARKQITTVEEAMQEAKKYMSGKEQVSTAISPNAFPTPIEKVDEKDYAALRQEIEEMLKGD